MKPIVSIIIPYFNHGTHLFQATCSALRSYTGPKEVLIVNDGSMEANSDAYLKSCAALSDEVRIIYQENKGLSAARNTGIGESIGDYIQFLDSDDILLPSKIDLQLAQFSLNEILSISLSNYLICDEYANQFTFVGDSIGRFDFNLQDFKFFWERGMSIPIHCGLFKRSVFEKIKFNTTVKGKEDWIFWCSLARNGMLAAYIPFFGAIYRQHAGGMSKSEKEMGECFLRATAIINNDGEDDLSFRLASRNWYESFYVKRIEASQRGQEGGARQASAERPQEGAAPSLVPGENPIAEVSVKAPARDLTLSVLIPVYNHYRDFVICFNSLKSQSRFSDIEVIIVDDCSSEVAVREYIYEICQRHGNVRAFRNVKNSGISITQNVAAAEASGEFLAFLDCDDYLSESAIDTVLRSIKSYGEEIDYFFSDRYDVDENGDVIRLASYGGYDWIAPSSDIAGDLLDGMVASHLKVIRRAQYMAVGGSDPEYDGVQDWDLAIKLAARGARFLHIPKPLYNYRLHRNSVSISQSVKQFRNSNRVRRRALCQKYRSMSSLDENPRSGLLDQVARARERPCLESISALKEKWLSGESIIYRCGADISPGEIAFIREFNSYYDLIITETEAVACALIGYMWDDESLIYEGELDFVG